MVLITISLLGGVALAKDPVGDAKPHTLNEETPEEPTIPTTDHLGRARPATGYGGYGSSHWTYEDSSDAGFKTEGSYKGFDAANDDGQYTTSPHGGYSTASNKCKVCHAVHRAEGAFKLMRSDTADDACNYCHIGDHKHSAIEAYSGAGGDIHASNGHTIGAGKEIPDSSTWMWSEPLAVEGGDPAENGGAGYSDSFNVRRYNDNRNKLMVWTWARSSHHQGESRWGPTLLTCMSCHQPHNAQELVWKPTGNPSGYKLLRASPSGSIKNKKEMETYASFGSRSMVIANDVSIGDTEVEVVRSGRSGGPKNYLYREVTVGRPFSPLFGNAQNGTTQNGKVIKVCDDNTSAGDQTSGDYIDTNANPGGCAPDADPPAGEARYYLDVALTDTNDGGFLPAGLLLYYGEHTAPTVDDYAVIQTNERVKAPEVTLADTTTFRTADWTALGAGDYEGRSSDPDSRFMTTYTKWNGRSQTLDNTRFASWCADCHNTKIGYPEDASTNFRGGSGEEMHSDRTHSSGTNYTECYICHRSDLPSPAVNEFSYEEDFKAILSQGEVDVAASTRNACYYKCHFAPSSYEAVRDISDWPHAGDSSSTKLLKDRVGAYETNGVTPLNVDGEAAYDASTEHIDSICVDCHNLMGEDI